MARRALIGTPQYWGHHRYGIGIGIFLIVVGAILTFAVDATVAGLNLDVVGWILMLAGVAGLIFFLYFWHRRRTPRGIVTERRSYDDTGQPLG